jgi:oxygen-independent coproporphyrinogen-3 oxidase
MSSAFDLALIQRYNTSGPRYTSYPTALQCRDMDAAQLASSVAESHLVNDDISLHLHIPCCATLYFYCACNKFVTKKYDLATRYLACWKTELKQFAPRVMDRKVSQIHWGGGTPTFLNNQDIESLMRVLRQNFNLAEDDLGEFGIEIDPRTVDADQVRHPRRVGFNRLSMGIQDFDPNVQKAVKRVQTYKDTESVFEAARA